MVLTQRHAKDIAEKLSAELINKREHDVAIIKSNDVLLGSYGIRRGSKELGHDYIPRQIGVTMRQAQDLANCPMSKEEYFEEIRRQGRI